MPRKNKVLNIEEIKASCKSCSLMELCLSHGMDDSELEVLEKHIKRHQPLQPGQHIYRAGESSRSLYAVRSGSLKSYCITQDGGEHVLGFTLPGELVGLDGLAKGKYCSSSVTLETSSICELPINQLEELLTRLPGLQKQLMRLVGKEITSDQEMLLLLGKRTADARLSAFLLDLSERYRSRGLSPKDFTIPMSRQDIGNYLGLAIETVSRLFAHFQEENLLTAHRKQITLHDLDRLRASLEGCVAVGKTEVMQDKRSAGPI